MSLLPFPENRDMVWDYLPELNRPLFRFYYFLLLLAGAGLFALCRYRLPVSVPVAGTVRPASERTEVHPLVAGIIAKMLVKEGDSVRQNGLLFILKDDALQPEVLANETELARQQQLVDDLKRLTIAGSLTPALLRGLQTPLYREQAAAFLQRESGETLNWTGARHETDIGRALVKDKVISPKEFYDQQLKEKRMQTTVNLVRRSQWATWQAELVAHRQSLAECLNRRTELQVRAKQMEIRAPLSGVIAGIRGWYAGCSVRPDQSLCTVSPEGELVGECFIPSRSAGLLRPGQPLRIRVDAFSSGQFGFLQGQIVSVSNDISFVDGKPAFTVRCRFLPPDGNGKRSYRGLLKKGFSFQASCVVAERTLFQLLYDRIEDWINAESSPSYSA